MSYRIHKQNRVQQESSTHI